MKTKTIRTISLSVAVLTSSGLFAQSPAAKEDSIFTMMFDNLFLIVGGVVAFAAVVTLVRMVNVLMDIQKIRVLDEHGVEAAEKAGLLQKNIVEKFNEWAWNIIPKERESSIDLGHDYDGIRELDNKLPPWWLALFYGSIIFAGIYMWNYHWSGSEWSSENQYIAEMKEGEAIKARFLDKAANSVDENSVVQLEDAASLEAGKDIYMSKCLACHGVNGEGMTGLGPNFCDSYWIHGGGIQNIFKTIKYGVPEKGMISWQSQMNPAAMQQVASYIMTLEGTNPPNQKEPQGTIWVAEENADNPVSEAETSPVEGEIQPESQIEE
jgi:cytochrome c oxidase cbb3-type subunit 3